MYFHLFLCRDRNGFPSFPNCLFSWNIWKYFFFPSLLLLCQLWWKLPSSFKSHQEQGWILTQSRFTVDKCISSVKQTKDLFCSISHFLESVMEKLLTRKRKDKIHLTKGRPQRRTNKSAAWKYIPISVLLVQRKYRENNSDLNICSIGIWSIPQPRTSCRVPALLALCFLSRKWPQPPDPPTSEEPMKFASVLLVVVQHWLTLRLVAALPPTPLLLLQSLWGVRGSTLKSQKSRILLKRPTFIGMLIR